MYTTLTHMGCSAGTVQLCPGSPDMIKKNQMQKDYRNLALLITASIISQLLVVLIKTDSIWFWFFLISAGILQVAALVLLIFRALRHSGGNLPQN